MNNLDNLIFSLLMLILLKLISLENAIAEGPPKKLASEGHRLIIFAQINESVTLKCPVESSSEFKTFVDWTKGNISLYNEQGYEITPKGFLKIKSVINQNSGIYTCEAINGYGSVRVNLTLVVVNPNTENKSFTLTNGNSANRIPTFPPTITRRPSSFSGDLGGEVTFHCISSGQPVPRIFWLKDGHLIPGSNSDISKRKTHSTLKLKGLKKSDAGNYKCIARNMLGEDEMDFRLHITESSPPPKILALDPPNVTVREGATIAFVCEVASRPGVQLHIKWLKRQEGLSDSLESSDINLFRYRPLNLTDSEFIRNGGVYKSKLFIRNSCEADSGTYVCLALNDKGFNFKNSTLKVIGTSNTLANHSHFVASSTPLAVTITFGFVVILAVVVFVSHICCRNKSQESSRVYGTSIGNVDSGSLKHSMQSVRKSNKGDMNPYPEIGDPPSSSKLLSIDSPFLYEHSESQISKLTHTRTSFH